MDSNLHTGDNINSSLVFMSSDGYFASQALRSGLFGASSINNPGIPKSGREAIGREIMKERIREEILAREIIERRILEDEVRREIELERMMELRRLQMERWSEFSGTSGMVTRCDSLGRGVVKDSAEFVFRERSLPRLAPKKTMAVMGQSALRCESEKISPSNETTTSNCKLSGAKRKAQDEFPIPIQKAWGCVICEISASSEGALKEHLQGKRHKAKESFLSSNKKTGLQQSKQNLTLPLEGASGGGSTKKKPAEGKKQQKFWCSLCRVKCNSLLVMDNHLAGKKHRAFMELSKANNDCKTEAVKSEANEKIGDSVKEECKTSYESVAPRCSSVDGKTR